MVAVQVETDPTFAAGQPEVLFSAAEFLSNRGHPQYDVAPDDQRFIMIRGVADVGATPKLILVQNFFEELKRLVPN